MITPVQDAMRQKIDLDQYDFEPAQVELVASVQGKHKKNQFKLGLDRLKEICNPDKEFFSKKKSVEKNLVFQTSSLGSIKLKTL